jgi:hypothetical protein
MTTKLRFFPSSSTWLALALCALITAVFAPGLSGDFLFDDFHNIVHNSKVHATALDWSSLRRAAEAYEPGTIARPLATVSFAIDYYFGQGNPWGYKLVNVLIHVFNALLVLLLVRTLLRLAPTRRLWPGLAALAIAAIWALHPLQVSTVLYVVQRMETLSLSFVLIGLLSYLKGRERQRAGAPGLGWLVLSFALAGIGLLSKETAALFPLYCLALEVTLLDFQAQRPQTRRALVIAYASGTALAIVVFLAAVLPHYTAPGMFEGRHFTLGERLLTQLRVLPMYLGWMLFPAPSAMTFYYDNYPVSQGLLNPVSTLLGGVLLLGLFVAAIALRKRNPLFSLGILWFFAAHTLTSNVIPLELVFEHRNYFALLGILLSAAALLDRLPAWPRPAMTGFIACALVATFAFLTVLRTATWGNTLLLGVDLAARNPQSSRAAADLATLYVLMSDSDPQSPFYYLAMSELERASRLPYASPMPEQGLIILSSVTGQPVDPAWWSRLQHKLKTLPVGPQEMQSVSGLLERRQGGVAMDDKRLGESCAILASRRALHPYLYATCADHALTYLHDPKAALALFRQAVEHSTGDPDYIWQIVGTLKEEGHPEMAQALLAHASIRGVPDAPGSIH